MKKITILLSILPLCGCVGILNNPYENFTTSQMSKVNSIALCTVANDKRYQWSENVSKEIVKRDLGNCSGAEVYCANLGLKRGSNQYTYCNLEYQKYELNQQALKAAQTEAYLQQEEQKKTRQDMQNAIMMSTLLNDRSEYLVDNSRHCRTTLLGGGMADTDCY
jgi:hypothetical protein